MENKCYICFKPAEHSFNMIIESESGQKKEEHFLCQLHKVELDSFKRKNAGRKEF